MGTGTVIPKPGRFGLEPSGSATFSVTALYQFAFPDCHLNRYTAQRLLGDGICLGKILIVELIKEQRGWYFPDYYQSVIY